MRDVFCRLIPERSAITNNDFLRALRYALDLSDDRMIATFAHAGMTVSRSEVSAWLKPDDDAQFEPCSNRALTHFLDGLIVQSRGKREGDRPEPDYYSVNNNIVLMKLKIALDLKAEELLLVLESGGTTISKHELSAFLRRPGHRQYRQCLDQILRNFLRGVGRWHRDDACAVPGGKWPHRRVDASPPAK